MSAVGANTYSCQVQEFQREDESFFSEWEHNNISQYATEDIYQI